MLYLTDEVSWMTLLGDWQGASLYALLLSVRHSEGAIPKHINIGHGR